MRINSSRAQCSYSDGFLSNYGKTSIGKDFNVYAENIFVEPEKIARLAGKYEVVAKKLGLLIDAYTAADPRLAEFFDKQALTDAAVEVAPVEVSISLDVQGINPSIHSEVPVADRLP